MAIYLFFIQILQYMSCPESFLALLLLVFLLTMALSYFRRLSLSRLVLPYTFCVS